MVIEKKCHYSLMMTVTNKKYKRRNKTKKIFKKNKSKIHIAIPSHNRVKLLQKYTLSLLKKHNFDFNYIFIFCSPESYNDYKKLQKTWGFNLIKSKDSITGIRNHMIKYFKSGTKVVEMDDDIEDIMNTKKGIKRTPVSDLQGLFRESFDMLGTSGMWGLNSTDSTMSPNGVDKFGTYTIINSCCGYINDKRIKLTVKEKEDFDRVAQFYMLKLPILKRGAYGIKTNYWNNPGGIQDRYDRKKRIQIQKESANELMKKFPRLFRKNVRSSGLVDIRFKGANPLRFNK